MSNQEVGCWVALGIFVTGLCCYVTTPFTGNDPGNKTEDKPGENEPLTLEEKAAYYGSQISESRSEITVDMKKHLSVLKMSTDDKTHISKKEVEDAYKKLARCYHTDKGGDVDNFHAIAEAKEALLLLIGTDASKESLLNVESLISTQAKIKQMKASLFQANQPEDGIRQATDSSKSR